MIRFEWLSDALCDVLRWQLANPGRGDDPAAPELPAAGLRVWGIFLALHAARGSAGFGPAPISHGEIEAYARLRREPLRGFEVDMVRALDGVYITDAAARVAGKSGEPKRVVASRPVSPALFDAVFSGAA